MNIRRIVIGKDEHGRSRLLSDGVSPRAHAMKNVPGSASAPLWSTPADPSITANPADPMNDVSSLVPPVGGTQFMVVTFPPDSVFASPAFDPVQARAERYMVSPGLAETFEADNPGMHTTPTIDYGVVLDGEIWLELDDGETVHLRRNDSFVQHGARHAWRNRSEQPATIAVVMIGAHAG